jgi:hypothetical protein
MISACLITKNGSDGLKQAIASIRPMVDEVVLVWTTCEARPAVEGVDRVDFFNSCNFQEDCSCGCGSKAGDIADFSSARNRSFELARGDRLTWLDSDDVVEGSPNALRDMTSRGLFVYAYSKEQTYYLPRLVPSSERWHYPIHEFLPGLEGQRSSNLVWRHRRLPEDGRISAVRNWRLMMHHMTMNAPVYEHDARMWYYWGRAFADLGKAISALSRLEKAYGLETWNEQRATIAILLARILPPHLVEIRRTWAWRAVQNMPRWPSAWRALAEVYSGDEREDFLRHAASLPLEDSFQRTAFVGSSHAHAA